MNAFNRTSQTNTGIAATVNRIITNAFSFALVGMVGVMTFTQYFSA